jgi:hypothetical protein
MVLVEPSVLEHFQHLLIEGQNELSGLAGLLLVSISQTHPLSVAWYPPTFPLSL